MLRLHVTTDIQIDHITEHEQNILRLERVVCHSKSNAQHTSAD